MIAFIIAWLFVGFLAWFIPSYKFMRLGLKLKLREEWKPFIFITLCGFASFLVWMQIESDKVKRKNEIHRERLNLEHQQNLRRLREEYNDKINNT